MRRKNDIERLKREVEIRDVLDYLNISYHKKGSAYFLLCPNPDHSDKKANNCYFKDGWNHVQCMVCGYKDRAIDIIMNERHCDYGTACDILWEIAGRPEWYYAKKEEDQALFYLTNLEAKKLGIYLPKEVYRQKSILPYHSMDLRSNERELMEEDSFIIEERETASWTDFMSDEQLASLVIRQSLLYKEHVVNAYQDHIINQADAKEMLALVNVIYKRAKIFRERKAA